MHVTEKETVWKVANFFFDWWQQNQKYKFQHVQTKYFQEHVGEQTKARWIFKNHGEKYNTTNQETVEWLKVQILLALSG